jgi:glycosyltransferase involved in cell wall biosynthesis
VPKPRILVCNQFFYPGYKAGGPVQSLVQLIDELHTQYEFCVLTSAYDLNSTTPYPSVATNTFTTVTLNNKIELTVYYSTIKLTKTAFKNIVSFIKPNIVFVNGMFDYNYCVLPFLSTKFFSENNIRLVISPRGMLQAGALLQKKLKKQIFLTAIKLFTSIKNAYWHATDEQEKLDIIKHFPTAHQSIFVASNVTKKPINNSIWLNKKSGSLQLIYLSIITPKKNLLLVIQVLANCKQNISLHIYGAIKEAAYWQQCQQLIQQLPSNISVVYKNTVEPENVQQTLQQYHALILLTQGENFGHALFEALSVGRPIITSNFTPWQQLQQQYAGQNIDIKIPIQSIAKELDNWANFNQEGMDSYYNGAYKLATKYFNQQHYQQQYQRLFALN